MLGYLNPGFPGNPDHSTETDPAERKNIDASCEVRLGDVASFTCERHIRNVGCAGAAAYRATCTTPMNTESPGSNSAAPHLRRRKAGQAHGAYTGRASVSIRRLSPERRNAGNPETPDSRSTTSPLGRRGQRRRTQSNRRGRGTTAVVCGALTKSKRIARRHGYCLAA